MSLDLESCFRAVRSRDNRFDGRFFVGVSSTGIYCRPICPVRQPKRANMRFFTSAAAAENGGFRPCLRCRPERAPGVATVDAAGRLVNAALARIEEHIVSERGVTGLASSLGVSDRHLRRVTETQLGVSPIELAQTQRLLLAKRLLTETTMPITEVALASGFGSVRRFNALFKQRYRLNPRGLRGKPATDAGLCCQLDFRPPYAWERVLAYFALRAIPGIEMVEDGWYRRCVAIDRHRGWIGVRLAPGGHALAVVLSPSLAPVIGIVLSRIKRQFDLGADPHAVAEVLRTDELLAPTVQRLPGLRVPGAFDGYELAVRTVIGQQVSVKSASTLTGRWAQAFGEPLCTPFPGLNRVAPTPEAVAELHPDRICAHGIIGARARTLIALSVAVRDRRIALAQSADVDRQIASLMELPGVGPWTAHYIAMRVLGWPDAFPGEDLMLLRASGLGRKQLMQRAQAWRPWRSYAAQYLWQSTKE